MVLGLKKVLCYQSWALLFSTQFVLPTSDCLVSGYHQIPVFWDPGRQIVEGQTGINVDRVSACEEDDSSQGVDKIKVPKGEYNQSRNKVDRVRILPKVTVWVACDEMLIGEDDQMKEQKNNSREAQVSSQQERCKTQQEMEVYNPSAKEKEYIW